MPLPTLLLLLVSLCPGAIVGDTPSAEQRALLTIDQRLADLEQWIESAERAADPDARIRFRYDWLRRDIAKLRAGLHAHIDRPSAAPQTPVELHGDYRR